MNAETQAIRRSGEARILAAASRLRPDTPDAGPMNPAKATAGSTQDLLRELSEAAADRLHAARRTACSLAVDETTRPARRREAMRALELCLRAAELAARR